MRPQGFYLVPVCQLSQGAGAGPNKTQGAGPRVDPGLTQGARCRGAGSWPCLNSLSRTRVPVTIKQQGVGTLARGWLQTLFSPGFLPPASSPGWTFWKSLVWLNMKSLVLWTLSQLVKLIGLSCSMSFKATLSVCISCPRVWFRIKERKMIKEFGLQVSKP